MHRLDAIELVRTRMAEHQASYTRFPRATPKRPSNGKPKEQDMSTTTNESMRNGVDTATLFATLDAVKQAPEAAKFQFRAHNEWVSGTHNRGSIADYFGVGEERAHERTFVFDA